MKYANIKYYDVANGPGVRTSLFVSGCTHRCEGCFNEIAWDFDYGRDFTKETIAEIVDSLREDYIAGITLLGGEPMEKVNQKGIFPLVSELKRRFPNKNLWIYSGYTFDIDLMPGGRAYCEETDKILSLCDVIVDGKFVESLYDITLRFRGSSNQRLIDVQRSLREGKAVLWEGDADFAVHSM